MKVNLRKIEELYTKGLKKYGAVPESVGWKDKAAQILRFKKLSEVVEDKENAIVVNELGCGYGAMLSFFIEEGFNISKYIGYDISQEMLKAARALLNYKDMVLIRSSVITRKADYSFTSGIYNVRFDIDDDSWREYIETSILNMSEFSKYGFAFNLLTTYVDFKKDHLYYGDPFYFFDFCKRNISKKVSLLHDYDLFEWTILVKK